MIKAAIHQSQYIPWVPYIKKVASADIFIIMDNVQFQSNGVQNRNRIRNKAGQFWLTVPVTGNLADTIGEKRIVGRDWATKHWKSLQASYSKAPFWGMYRDELFQLYEQNCSTLLEVNQLFFTYLIKKMSITTKIIHLSDLNINAKKADLVLQACKDVNAEIYISGTGSKAYLNEEIFRQEGIRIDYQPSIPPSYDQFHGDFIDGLSIIDMLMNVRLEEIVAYVNTQ
ncbi:WbqC family protein [Paenibacillus sepulcri]|uniref:WbqC family protein n=1 Tax=Paenibacillus sepulcri TaxID=359917 RepID=A0ABS7BV82_9BACL|nr:WbqC family protein [Paenibacillus sepulcri]